MTPARDPRTPARAEAHRVLTEVSRGRRLDRALAVLDRPDAEPAAVRRLAEGVVRWRGRIDHLLGRHVRRGLASVHPELLDILRLGTHEVLHEPRTPDYAAVSEAVDAARGRMGAGPARFANAVLRKVAATGLDPAAFPDPVRRPAAYLATWGSHPAGLVERWVRTYGVESATALIDANNRPAPLFLRPVCSAHSGLGTVLEEMGVEGEPVPFGLPNLRLGPVRDLAVLLRRTQAIIQDPAATAVTAFLPDLSEWALDLCAAPGGKAVGLWCRGASAVVAADRSRSRLRLLRDTAARLGAPLHAIQADAAQPVVAAAPVVLLDAPCTGTGTLRRHPDARWRWSARRLQTLTGLQDALLDGAAAATAPGGLLVYSTCSLEPEENGECVDRFLARWPDFSLNTGEPAPGELQDPRGRLLVRPWTTGFDGAFAARLRRRARAH